MHMNDKIWVTIPYLHGVQGDFAVTFIDATFSTPDNVRRTYPGADFVDWLLSEIYDNLQRFAIKKGLLSKKYYCPVCGDEINPDRYDFLQTEHRLRYKELSPFTIRIIVPSVRCPHCQKISGVDLDGKANYHLKEAILQAFKNERITPK